MTVSDERVECVIESGNEPAYGGVCFSGPAADAVRCSLAVTNGAGVVSLYVDGYDGRGHDQRENRLVRWQWQTDSTSFPAAEPAEFVLAPGQPSGYFRSRGDVGTGPSREFHIFAKIKPHNRVTLVIDRLEVGKRN